MNHSETNHPAWMDDELVKNIPSIKLDFLEKIFNESRGKNQKDMMSFLMPMMKRAKQENLTFSTQEMNAAITAIRKYSSDEENRQIDSILKKAGH